MEQAAMNRELRVLMLEDMPADAELAGRELRKAGIAFTSLRVETRDAFTRALEVFHPDIVLSDYNLPDFNGMAALEIVQRGHPEVPVVMVTGALSDIEAVELIHAGARDYVLKDHLVRLAPAVQQVLSAERGARARKAAEKALRESEAKFRALVESTSDWIWEIDEQAVYTYASPQVYGLLGYTAGELIGKTPFDLMQPDEAARVKERFSAIASERKPFRLLENANLHKNGRVVFLETSGAPMFDAQGVFRGYRGIGRDITERKQAELELRIAATAFETQEGILITDRDKHILRVNQAFTRLTGYSAAESIGRTPAMLKSGRHDEAFYRCLWETLTRDKYWQGEIWNQRKNGEIFPEWLTITAVLDADGQVTHYVGVFSDITLRKEADEKIYRLAFYDPLTGLPNRRLLMDRLQQAMASGARSQREGALLFLDLDDFKTLNDTRGHDIGDLLLIEVAERLRDCVRGGDTVARLGGDEFVVMLEDLSEDTQQAAAAARDVGEKVLAAINQPFDLQGVEYHGSSSIGISLFRGGGIGMDDLLKHADTAMYQAKASGRNTLRFFDPAMQAQLEMRAALADDLRQALPRRQFKLYYQIQVNEQGVAGAEALLRWQHPERGLVLPMEFIPLAEETGLIVPIGAWVLQMACVQLKAWQTDPLTRHLQLAVNVSARQFRQPDFVEQVLDVLKKADVDPLRLGLEFELTESLVLHDIDDSIGKMQALRNVGIRFSLDDFGTGQSSLSYLKRLPLDQIKIDRSFLCDVATDPNDAAIVRTIIGMADNLGLNVIAEGVETEQQRDFLERNGCHAYQGHLFGKPVPIEAFRGMVSGLRS